MFDRSNGVSDKKDFHETVLSYAEALYSPEYLEARSETISHGTLYHPS